MLGSNENVSDSHLSELSSGLIILHSFKLSFYTFPSSLFLMWASNAAINAALRTFSSLVKGRVTGTLLPSPDPGSRQGAFRDQVPDAQG